MPNKSTEQRVAEAAIKYVGNRYAILADDVRLELALAQVVRYIEQQDDSISPERIVQRSRAACEIIRERFRQLAEI